MFMRKPSSASAAPTLLIALILAVAPLIVAAAETRTVLADDLAQVTVKDARANQTATSDGGTLYGNLGTSDIFKNSGTGLRVNGAWAIGYTRFDPVTLAAPGDCVTLRLTIRYENAPASIGGALRLGLYDSRKNPATLFPQNPNTNPAGDSASGYFVTLNTGGADQTNLFRDPGDKTITKGAAVFTTSGDNRIIGFKGAAFGTEPQPVVFTIECTTAGLKFWGEVAGTPFVISNEKRIGIPITTTFDTFIFGSGNLSGAFTITGVKITTNTPPASPLSP